MQYVSVVDECECPCVPKRDGVFFVDLQMPLNPSWPPDPQTTNGQRSMWAEITLDNDGNKMIKKSKDGG